MPPNFDSFLNVIYPKIKHFSSKINTFYIHITFFSACGVGESIISAPLTITDNFFIREGKFNGVTQFYNGMLRKAFGTLEGCNLLQHIIEPPPTPTPIFVSLSCFALDLVACQFGWTFDGTRSSRRLAIRLTNEGMLNQRGCI